MKILRSLPMIAIVVLASLPLFAQISKPKADLETHQNNGDESGLLYKITGNNLGKPSYLFGTLHAICPNDLFGTEELKVRLKETERLYLELDFDDPQVINEAANALDMPEGKTLRNFLTPEKYARVDEMFRNLLGVRVSSFGRVSPLGLSAIVSGSPQSTGCREAVSYETKLVEMAAADHKTVDGLETVEEQLVALNVKPLEKQAEDLYKLSLDPQKPIDEFKDLVTIYKSQDAGKLAEFIAKQTSADPQLASNMLTARNRKWMPSIERIIDERSTFIAVGGGHLGGKYGIVNLLRQKGYTMTAIKL